MRDELSGLDDLEMGDLWRKAKSRTPSSDDRDPRRSPRSRVIAGVVAVVVAAAAFAFVRTGFKDDDPVVAGGPDPSTVCSSTSHIDPAYVELAGMEVRADVFQQPGVARDQIMLLPADVLDAFFTNPESQLSDVPQDGWRAIVEQERHVVLAAPMPDGRTWYWADFERRGPTGRSGAGEPPSRSRRRAAGGRPPSRVARGRRLRPPLRRRRHLARERPSRHLGGRPRRVLGERQSVRSSDGTGGAPGSRSHRGRRSLLPARARGGRRAAARVRRPLQRGGRHLHGRGLCATAGARVTRGVRDPGPCARSFRVAGYVGRASADADPDRRARYLPRRRSKPSTGWASTRPCSGSSSAQTTLVVLSRSTSAASCVRTCRTIVAATIGWRRRSNRSLSVG